jgi:outer membrane phospholipase A
LFYYCSAIYADETKSKVESLVGLNDYENFSLYQSNYFIFGKHDLAMQFSFKYRLARSVPFYLGFTQKMFWSIYEDSKPFKDINYIPETFYRILDKNTEAFKALDLGYMHLSNGKKEFESRSLDRVFVRANYFTRFDRHNLDFNLMVFKIFNNDNSNQDIERYLGYWDLKMALTNLIIYNTESMDFEIRLFAGSKITDLSKGASQIGLIYNFASLNMNPAIYLQRYNGYAQNLVEYSQFHSEYRLGFLLSY